MTRVKDRIGFVLAAVLATVTLYAEGVLKDGLIEVVLLLPVVWYLVAPKKPSLLQNLVLSLMFLSLAMSSVDLVLRPLIGSRLHFSPLNVFTRKLPQLPIVGRWDPSISFRGDAYGDLAAMAGNPNLREPRQIAIQTDEAGFRNEMTPHSIDLTILGDSFGAGSGTTQEKIMSEVLHTKYGLATYNLSFPASGPWHQYINFAIESPRLTFSQHAVLIWLLYTGNDMLDDYGETWSIDALPWKSGIQAWMVSYRTFLGRSPLNQLANNLRGRRAKPGERQGKILTPPLPDGRPVLFLDSQEEWSQRTRAEVEHHPNFSKLVQTLHAMKQVTDRRGVRTVVMVLPTKGEVYRWILDQREPIPDDALSSGFAQAVLAACNRVQLRCLDTKPYLAKEAFRLFTLSGELLWWRDDTHLGEHGHDALATFIAHEMLNGRRTHDHVEAPEGLPSLN